MDKLQIICVMSRKADENFSHMAFPKGSRGDSDYWLTGWLNEVKVAALWMERRILCLPFLFPVIGLLSAG